MTCAARRREQEQKSEHGFIVFILEIDFFNINEKAGPIRDA